MDAMTPDQAAMLSSLRAELLAFVASGELEAEEAAEMLEWLGVPDAA